MRYRVRASERPLRIALLSPPWYAVPPSGYGGVELVIHLLAEGLVARGLEVTLFASGDSETPAELSYVFEEAPSERIGESVWELSHVMQAEARFVSDPRDAACAAERVVMRVLAERGYPTEGDTEDQAARVAVDHPDVVERYRHAHAMLDKVDGAQGTENLRKAMNDFRSVLHELLEREPAPV